jgi:hypothetical protein
LEASTDCHAKAFRSELVSQDPNDELAEKLPERIRQVRAGMEAGVKGRKKPSTKPKRAKAMVTARFLGSGCESPGVDPAAHTFPVFSAESP